MLFSLICHKSKYGMRACAPGATGHPSTDVLFFGKKQTDCCHLHRRRLTPSAERENDGIGKALRQRVVRNCKRCYHKGGRRILCAAGEDCENYE